MDAFQEQTRDELPSIPPETGCLDGFQIVRGSSGAHDHEAHRDLLQLALSNECSSEYTAFIRTADNESHEQFGTMELDVCDGDAPCRKELTPGSSRIKGVRKTLHQIRAQKLDGSRQAFVRGLADSIMPNIRKPDRSLASAATAEGCAHWLQDIKIVRDWQSYCPYASNSAKLRHIYEDDRPQVSSLPLFGSSRVTPCTDRRMANFYDLVINVGGSVWALDWCPQRQEFRFDIGGRSEFLAVGAHPSDLPVHTLGEPVLGRGLIQIWAFNMESVSSTTKGNFDLPQMVLGLAHNGGVTWDAKWQPATVQVREDKKELHRLGYLAVLFGDGSLQVFDVPLPSLIQCLRDCENREPSINPVIVHIKPVFKCSGLPAGGQKSMPLVLEWSSSPHHLLLAGCHDGVVAMWKFSTGDSSDVDTRPLMCFVADSAPIRAVAWAPDGHDTESQNVIVIGGHSGHIQFWDLRDPFHSLWDVVLSKGGCVLSIDWLSSPRCVIVAMDDGSIRTLSLDMAASDTPITGKACTKTVGQGLHSYFCSSFAILTVQVARSTGLALCGGEDGSVIQFRITEKSLNQERIRSQYTHHICGQFKEDLDSGVLSIISQDSPVPIQMKKCRTDNNQTPLSKMLMTASAVNDDGDGSSGKKISKCLSTSVKGKGSNKQSLIADFSFHDVNEPLDESAESLAMIPYDSHGQQDPGSASLEDSLTVDHNCARKRGKQQKQRKKSLSASLTAEHSVQSVDSLAMVSCDGEADVSSSQKLSAGKLARELPDSMPPKSVSVHRVRWNQNKGCENLMCFGGAAGIVRFRLICPRI